MQNQEKYKITVKEKDSINIWLETITEITNENDLPLDKVIVHDIMVHGSDAICFHLEIEPDDFPEDLETACEELFFTIWTFCEDKYAVKEFVDYYLDNFYEE